jgi:hypothetical protein
LGGNRDAKGMRVNTTGQEHKQGKHVDTDRFHRGSPFGV